MRLPFPQAMVAVVLSLGAALSSAAAPHGNHATDSKTVITKVGETHFEASLPSGVPLRLYVRSGAVRLIGSDDAKISVDISGKNAYRCNDVRHRLEISGGIAEFRLSGGPRNDIQITIRLPRNSDLRLRVPAGDVSVEGIVGNKDVEIYAGDLSIQVGDPKDYSHVDASVNAGDVDAAPFGESHSGLFRSFSKSGSGKLTLHAHVGAGDLTLI
jgi:hypothetical protein